MTLSTKTQLGDAGKTRDPSPGQTSSPVTYLLVAYRQILISLFFSVLILIAMFFIFFWNAIFDVNNSHDAPSPVLICVLAGALGAVFSSLIRVYNFEELPAAITHRDLKDLGNPYLLVYSVIPVFIGAISAAAIYVIFSSGLIAGSLFPTFACKAPIGGGATNTCPEFIDLLTHWGPKEAVDYAKVIIWGLVAGFAERLVPNTMDNLASSVKVKTE